jgi:hypothetical protein
VSQPPTRTLHPKVIPFNVLFLVRRPDVDGLLVCPLQTLALGMSYSAAIALLALDPDLLHPFIDNCCTSFQDFSRSSHESNRIQTRTPTKNDWSSSPSQTVQHHLDQTPLSDSLSCLIASSDANCPTVIEEHLTPLQKHTGQLHLQNDATRVKRPFPSLRHRQTCHRGSPHCQEEDGGIWTHDHKKSVQTCHLQLAYTHPAQAWLFSMHLFLSLRSAGRNKQPEFLLVVSVCLVLLHTPHSHAA